jgi:IclR family acetate operon transcriptional repressor
MDTTVAKGFAVLEVLARAKKPMRLSALTEVLGFQKSNVHRLLGTLIELGYVQKDEETARYFASLKAWEMGVAIISTNALRRMISPHLQKLHQLTQDTVLLTVPVDGQVLFLDRVAPARVLRYTPLNGTRAPMTVTASGRIFLSAMHEPQDIIRRGLAERPDLDMTLDQIMQELPQIRSDGFATVTGGLTARVRAVAAAISGPDGRPVAAITVSNGETRMSGDHLQEAIEALLSACAEIGEISSF